MSVRMMGWAWRQPNLSTTAKIVLLALADHSDDEGNCWPGQRGIAEKCDLARQTVNRIVGELAKAGLISVEHRQDELGRPTSNFYRLCVRRGGNVTDDDTPIVTDDDTIRHPERHDPSSEPSKKEPSVKKHISARRPETPWPEALALDDAMSAYARKAGIDPEREFAAWENDCLAHDRRYRDWHHAWRTRIDNALKFGGVRSYGNRHGSVLNAGNALILQRMEELNGQRTGNGDPAQGQSSVAPAIGGRRNNGGVG